MAALYFGLAGEARAARPTGMTHRVDREEQFRPALEAAASGDVVLVACDTGGLSIKGKHGTEGGYITIKADRRLGRTLKGTVTIQDCSYLRLEGFVIAGFTANALKIIASHHLVVTGNMFDFTGVGSANGIYTSCTGGQVEDLEISHNEFNHHTAAGAWTGSYIKTWFNGTHVASRLWIHHNYFAHVAPKVDRPGTANPFDGDSDRETIIFGEGDSQNLETHNLIEFNLFEDCDGEDEIISFKTSKNIFRYNTLKNCMGSVHIRFGHASEVYGNFFTGDVVTNFEDAAYTSCANHESGGVVIYGTDHKVYNNHFQNLTGGRTSRHRLPLVIDAGDTDATTGNDHPRAQRVLVVHNTFANCQYGIGVGLNYKLPPRACIVANNLFSGIARTVFRMSADAEADTTCTYAGNLAWITGTATGGTGKPLLTADRPLLIEAVFNGYAIHIPDAPDPALHAARGHYVTDDVFGGARSGTPDIGAREAGAATPRQPLTVRDVGPLGRAREIPTP